MACPHSYLIQIEGVRMPESDVSHRGTQVHHVMAQYVRECTGRKITSDPKLFDQLAKAVGSEAGGILDGMRDNHPVDWQHVLATEIVLALDEDFMPTYFWVDEHGEVRTDVRGVKIERIPGVEYSEKPAAYIGTLDVLMLANIAALVRDYKSHWRPFDPDTFQSKLYPLLVLQHFTQVEKVTFELIFVRYRNVRRQVSFERENMVGLMREVERARQRQIEYHEAKAADRDVPVLPGDHCQYCVLLHNLQCPIRESNPSANVPIEERLRFQIWADKMREANMPIIKSFVDANDPLTVTDANGTRYTANYHEKESEVYLALETVAMCMEWNDANGGMEKAFLAGLTISSSSIKSKLKANKRADLHKRMRDERAIRMKGKVTFSVKDEGSGEVNTAEKTYEGGEEF